MLWGSRASPASRPTDPEASDAGRRSWPLPCTGCLHSSRSCFRPVNSLPFPSPFPSPGPTMPEGLALPCWGPGNSTAPGSAQGEGLPSQKPNKDAESHLLDGAASASPSGNHWWGWQRGSVPTCGTRDGVSPWTTWSAWWEELRGRHSLKKIRHCSPESEREAEPGTERAEALRIARGEDTAGCGGIPRGKASRASNANQRHEWHVTLWHSPCPDIRAPVERGPQALVDLLGSNLCGEAAKGLPKACRAPASRAQGCSAGCCAPASSFTPFHIHNSSQGSRGRAAALAPGCVPQPRRVACGADGGNGSCPAEVAPTSPS